MTENKDEITDEHSSGGNVEDISSIKYNVIEDEHSHWKKTSDIMHSDAFLHHVNNYTNWFNNSHEIVRHQARPFIKPQALSSLTCAYGTLMPSKLIKCLEDHSLHVRQKALVWIVELLATQNARVQCFTSGMLEAFTKRFDEEDIFMKQQISLALKHFAGMQQACVKMCDLGVINWLLKMISFDDEKLREYSLSALYEASFNETVRIKLVQEELTIPFIMKTSKEICCNKCSTLGLKILQRCLAGGTDKAAICKLLCVDAIPTLLDLMKVQCDELREASIRLIGLLGMNMDGKSQVHQYLGIQSLLPLLRADNLLLKIATTSALMSATINIDAKNDFINSNGIEPILPLIDDCAKILSFNSLQLAANLSENPNGRSQLQKAIPMVQHLMTTSQSQIQKRFAKTALQQLKFKYRPFI